MKKLALLVFAIAFIVTTGNAQCTPALSGLFHWYCADCMGPGTAFVDGDTLWGDEFSPTHTWTPISPYSINYKVLRGNTRGNNKNPIYHTNIVNGKPAIRFENGGAFYEALQVQEGAYGDTAYFKSTTGAAVFVIVKSDNDHAPSANVGGLFAFTGADYTTLYDWTADSKIYAGAWRAGVGIATVNPVPALNTWRVYGEASKDNKLENFLDAATLFTTTSNTFVGQPNNFSWRIGATENGIALVGYITDIMVYYTYPGSAQIDSIQNYYQTKYVTGSCAACGATSGDFQIMKGN